MFATESISSTVACDASLAGPVSKRFASRPRLYGVAARALTQDLQEPYPTLACDWAVVYLMQPSFCPTSTASGSLPAFEGYEARLLVEVLVERFIEGRTLNLDADRDFLTQEFGSETPAHLAVAMHELEWAIARIAPTLLQRYQAALAEFWSAADAQGITPWAWLADDFRTHLSLQVAQLKAAGQISGEQLNALEALAEHREVSAIVRHQPGVEVFLAAARQAGAAQIQVPVHPTLLVVLAATASEPQRVATYQALAGLQLFQDRQQAVQHLQEELEGEGSIVLAVPEGDVFAAFAGCLLDLQLEQISNVRGLVNLHRTGASGLAAVLDQMTCLFALDAARQPTAVERLEAALPVWLRGLEGHDRTAMGMRTGRYALSRRKTRGAGYLQGIPTLREFAETALQAQITQQAGPTNPLKVADIELHLLRVPNAELSLVGAGDQHLEDQVIGLVDLALTNLASRPAGHMVVKLEAGRTLPDWLDETQVQRWVRAVDVGAKYPALLQRQLLDDAGEYATRSTAYAQALCVNLPLLSLENTVRALQGFSSAADRLVKDIFRPSHMRLANAQVQRLAFVRAPGAPPDIVDSMYLLRHREADLVVLYRPLSESPLMAFDGLHALFLALAQPGDLQQDVLAWMDDAARVIYAQGGFHAPHVQRFLPGDEYAPLSVPPPARLIGLQLGGPLQEVLYRDQAEGLIRLARHQAVSNEEDSARHLKQLAQVVFNLVAPFVPEPWATPVWLAQMLALLDNGLEHEAQGDSRGSDEAFIELALNVAFVLLGRSLNELEGFNAGPEGQASGVEHPAAFVPIEFLPRPFERPTGLVPFEGPLDFSWATPDLRLSAGQAAALARMKVQLPAAARFPISHGPWQGLFLDSQTQTWFVQLDSGFYRAHPWGDEMRLVDPGHPEGLGPLLRRDDVGRWALDLRLRLRGGQPKKRLVQMKEERARLEREAEAEYEVLAATTRQILQRLKIADDLMTNARAHAPERLDAIRARNVQENLAAVETMDRARKEFARCNQAWPVPNFARRAAEQMKALIQLAANALFLIQEKLTEVETQFHGALEGREFAEITLSDNPERLWAYLKQRATPLEDRIRVRERITGWLDELHGLGARGREVAAGFEAGMADYSPILNWKSMLVDTYSLLTLERVSRNSFEYSRLQPEVQRARWAAQNHRAVLEDKELALRERAQVLHSVVDQYATVAEAIEDVRLTTTDDIVTPYWDKLLAALEAARAQGLTDFQSTLRAAAKEERAERKALQKEASKARTIVIKTRQHGAVLGKARVVQGDGAEYVDMINPDNQQVTATFRREPRAEEWEALVPQASAPRIPLGVTLREARLALQRADQDLARMQKGAGGYTPLERQEVLERRANFLDSLQGRIEEALTRDNATDEPNAQGESAAVSARQLNEKATSLRTEGRALRISGTLAEWPTATGIDFLAGEGVVHIARLGERKLLEASKRRDYLQEFSVRDAAGKLLCYAHFHYPTLETPAGEFTAAHFKRVEQRYEGGQNGGADIYRAPIGDDLARRRFLPLLAHQAS